MGCASTALASGAASFRRFDSHVHVFKSDPAYLGLLDRLNLFALDICVVDKHDRGYEDAASQWGAVARVHRESHGRIGWATTFDLEGWRQDGFTERVLAELDGAFARGAVAVKIYKSIGMELRDRDGRYVMPDDPTFTQIFDRVAARGKTLIAHLAEPDAAWLPLDPASPHESYYRTHPAWHVYGDINRPSKGAILAARDRILARHPTLRVVGAHLGSMENDVAEIARRLDAYPNFAVDTAGRIADLFLQPRKKVRDFLIAFQDRVLYATDVELMPWSNVRETVRQMEEQYARDWVLLATDGDARLAGRKVQGLALPLPVLRKIYYENALRWFPGVRSVTPGST